MVNLFLYNTVLLITMSLFPLQWNAIVVLATRIRLNQLFLPVNLQVQ